MTLENSTWMRENLHRRIVIFHLPNQYTIYFLSQIVIKASGQPFQQLPTQTKVFHIF